MSLPTAAEQEMLEWINRARMDPTGELARLVPSMAPLQGVNQDVTSAMEFWKVDLTLLQQQFALLQPTTPLAWNTLLEQSSAFHSAQMIATDTQSHQVPGEPGLGDRVTATGYDLAAVGENIFAYAKSVVEGHAALMIDWGTGIGGIQNPPGHRDNIMDRRFTEIGIDITQENNLATNVGPLVVTQNLGSRFNFNPMFVGVVFGDLDGDNFYDAGEGKAGVTITVTGVNGTFTTTTWASGGYQVVAPAGNYTLEFSGGGMAGKTVNVTINLDNVKVDHFSLAPPAPIARNGTDADDTMNNTGENEAFDGKLMYDTLVSNGLIDDYTITRTDNRYTIVDNTPGRDGSDRAVNIEKLKFTDRSMDLSLPVKASGVPESSLNSLIELYIAYFNRVPEAAGLGYWIDQLKGGKSLNTISQEFYAAGVAFSEVSGYTATMPLADFIKIVYANVLIRPTPGPFAPPQGDIDYWVAEISSGRVTKEALIQRMLSDARVFANDPDWGFVTKVLDHKIALGKYHAITLGLDYTSGSEAIQKTKALSQAVAPTGIDAAVAIIGLADNVTV